MIEKVFLNNFQGFGENASADLGQITLIFGPNASGKSSISRALRVMKQSAADGQLRSGHFWSGSEIDMGAPKNAVRGQLENRRGPFIVSLGLTLTGRPESADEPDEDGYSIVAPAVPAVSYIVTEDVRDRSLKIETSAVFPTESGEGPSLVASTYLLKDLALSAEQAFQVPKGWDEDDPDKLSHAIGSLKEHLSVQGNTIRFRAPEDYPDFLEDQFSLYPEVEPYLDATLVASNRFRSELLDLTFIPPIRPVPPKFEVFESDDELDRFQSATQDSKFKTAQDLMLRLTAGRYSSEIRVFKEQYSGAYIRVNMVQDRSTGAKLGFDQVGMGLSQISPIVSDIAAGTGTTHIEQPELHLHPKMQRDLMDAFIDCVNSDPERQFLIETHSETMLLRAQKRVRDGLLDPQKLKVLFVDSAELDDGTRFNSIQQLKLDNTGDFLDPLPISFMNLRMKDLL